VSGSRPLGRRRDDRGSGLVEVVWVGLILMLPLIWIVTSVFEVQRGAFANAGAARAAGRAYALAGNDPVGRARASAAAAQAFRDQGIAHASPSVGVSCSQYPCHSGGAVITVTVRSRVDLPLLPQVLGGGAPTFPVTSTHTVPIGQYQEASGG